MKRLEKAAGNGRPSHRNKLAKALKEMRDRAEAAEELREKLNKWRFKW